MQTKVSKNKKTKGFTLVETLVAISILMLAMTGPLTIAGKGLSSAAGSKNQLTAVYLAQEGIEVIRNLRDKNALNGQSWMNGLAPCFNTCTVDALSASQPVTACATPSTCPAINYDDTSGLYGSNSGWPASNFTRAVTITAINPNEVLVESKVSWQGFTTKNTTVKTLLFNWH